MIVGIRFVSTFESVHHNEDERTQLGRVEILYDDGTLDSFSNVDRGKYFRWITNGFRDEDAPSQIELRDESEEDEDDEEDEELIATVFGALTEDETIRLERLFACPILRL